MCDRESALLAAIAATPTDLLVRGVLADWYDDEQRHDEADAVRATAGKVPGRVHPLQEWRNQIWYWVCPGKKHNRQRIWGTVFRHLSDADSKNWISHRYYPTFTLALLDLIRAWCAVHRSEVPAVDGVSV